MSSDTKPMTHGSMRQIVAIALAAGSGMLTLGWFSRGAIMRSEMADQRHDQRHDATEQKDKEQDAAIASLIHDYLKARQDIDSWRRDLDEVRAVLFPPRTLKPGG